MVLKVSSTTSSAHAQTTPPLSKVKVVALIALAAFSAALAAIAFKKMMSTRNACKDVPQAPLPLKRTLSLPADLKSRMDILIRNGLQLVQHLPAAESEREAVLASLGTDVSSMSTSVTAFLEQRKSVSPKSCPDASRIPSYLPVHELRTPLQNLFFLLSLSSAERPPIFFKQLQENYNLLLRLLEDVPNDSTQNVEMCLHLAPFSLNRLCRQVDMQTNIYAGQHNVAIHYLIPVGGDTMLIGDCHRLGQILSNLITNGVKYSGNPTIEVSAEINADQVCFKVIDHGQGISGEDQTKLFCSFSQLESGRAKSAVPSSGVGLFFCKNVVELMNGGKQGVIGIRETAGGGSTFWFTIPYTKAPLTAEKSIELHNKDLTILVADDSIIIQKMYVKFLQGAHLDVVCNGTLAVEKFAAGNHHIVILDMEMPEKSGPEVAAEIQKLAQKKMPYIIFISGNPKEEVEQALTQYQLDRRYLSILTKDPLKKERLITTINQAMSQREL